MGGSPEVPAGEATGVAVRHWLQGRVLKRKWAKCNVQCALLPSTSLNSHLCFHRHALNLCPQVQFALGALASGAVVHCQKMAPKKAAGKGKAVAHPKSKAQQAC